MKEFLVAGAVVEHDGRLLLVRNRRRGGFVDWSTPGGVIDAADASPRAGLTREVEEETGLRVLEWEGPLYDVVAVATDMGWTMRCEVYRAVSFEGTIRVDDPDGIVEEAVFLSAADAARRLTESLVWVREPLAEWLAERWEGAARRAYRYELRGREWHDFEVLRTAAG
ncbi:MAG: NUDIX hydrolase [Acidimicrobiia bacterium]|nr:NUDIX hydrolase [Acidimicrobiia bacterium]MCL4293898.1 NUDIX hydrolase [Acidimicrobiia bacterium]